MVHPPTLQPLHFEVKITIKLCTDQNLFHLCIPFKLLLGLLELNNTRI